MNRIIKLAVLSLALAAALTLMLFACAKPVDAGKYDDGPAAQDGKMSEVEKPADPAMENQEGAEPQDAAVIFDDFEFPAENRTANQTLPDFGEVKNGLELSEPVAISSLDELIRIGLPENGAVIVGRKIASVSYSRYDGRVYHEAFEGVYSDIVRSFTLTRFYVTKVSVGENIPAIITLAEEYSFRDDGSAYQSMPLYSPPIYDDADYLLFIAPDDGYDKGAQDVWKVTAAIRIDDFSRGARSFTDEEITELIAKRGYFAVPSVAKEAIERFAGE
ncbi:MAG: hypothetical protein IJL41_06175 [Clostridia bacterium]|nr:hypothetical protein [Clostridia bacterium]